MSRFIIGTISTRVGPVSQVASHWSATDYLGTLKARFNISRMDYKVAPGVYAVNRPDEKSPVFVSANYKMSFDYLRKALSGMNVWLLVIDTKGINVWCAAGKGTFGTKELVARIQKTQLQSIVSHRKLVVPQLGAPGVAAHEVRAQTGFHVSYGPVRAVDIPEYIGQGMKATQTMRQVTFPFWERMVLIPVEVTGHFKYALWALVYFAAFSAFGHGGFSWDALRQGGLVAVVMLFAGMLAGTAGVPMLLPYIPGRAFAWKGALLGSAVFVLLVMLWPVMSALSVLQVCAWALIVISWASFTAMNFTGTSTFTSLSGVLKEMKIALPIQIGGALLGVILWTVGQFIS